NWRLKPKRWIYLPMIGASNMKLKKNTAIFVTFSLFIIIVIFFSVTERNRKFPNVTIPQSEIVTLRSKLFSGELREYIKTREGSLNEEVMSKYKNAALKSAVLAEDYEDLDKAISLLSTLLWSFRDVTTFS